MKNSMKSVSLAAFTVMTMFMSGIAGAAEKSVVLGGYSFDEPSPKSNVRGRSTSESLIKLVQISDDADPVEKKYFDMVSMPPDMLKPTTILLYGENARVFSNFDDCKKGMNEVHSFLSKKYNASPTPFRKGWYVEDFNPSNVKFSNFRNGGKEYFITTGCMMDNNRISLFSQIELL